MAASLGIMSRLWVAGIRGAIWGKVPVTPLRSLCTQSDPFDTASRYKDQPWEYLASEEYLERYGQAAVWVGYRRNHKGAIPPQKTRKTCIRGGKVCGNPCPICRDQKLGLHYRNVKLLQQFISPHTGTVYDPTRTGVCQKQQKILAKTIEQSKDHGFLSTPLSHVDLPCEDYSNTHGAVARTLPPPSGPWYSWYEWQEPPARELARVRKLYAPFQKVDVADKADTL
ncbi:small ribosomal subunit protein mS40 [Ascaphus truei]|uniref:small ribosomal subunit protein mS40 n=1 Tax=Ascaphus truei TaxID=8439 RepID=UPI003F59FEB8